MKEQGWQIRVRGQVQGVGFRPFVWQLAQARGLRGAVLNDAEGVLIRVLGPVGDLPEALKTQAPPLARVDAVEVSVAVFEALPNRFEIIASGEPGAETRVTPDAATCPACLEEIRGHGRRRGYAFTNCTHCGPRFTILQSLPYDRARTTMAPFEMCPECRAEYENPADRRFHAQPIACPTCGPRIWLEVGGQEVPGDTLALAVARLHAGEVLAIKGLGGFHLACDAANPRAVAELRARKRRPAKPFALMCREGDLAQIVTVSPQALSALKDPAAPIVLMPTLGTLPANVAPGMTELGVMLPYTPLHHLLLDAFQGVLVMTSGNLSGEPQVVGNDEAREKLAPFADAFVMHDRAIARRLDDSVLRVDPPMVLRRARGQVPGTLPLPPGFEDAPQIVACGGQMKAALCLIKNGQALLGHHLGELDEALTWEAYLQADADYAALFDHQPQAVAVDLHPDFRASRHGAERAEREGLQLIEVQHHHAHLAAVLGENLWPRDGGKVAGIILDGLGLGPDGTVWGGELLLGDYAGFERRAWLKPAPLIGGDRAQMEPWRNALVRLDAAGLSDWADALFPKAPREIARQMAAKGVNAPLSSSAGRLFDAVAGCLGLCAAGQSYEGEAAMRLEALAARAEASPQIRFAGEGAEIDPAPLFLQLAEGGDAAGLAYAAHEALAEAFAVRARAFVQSGAAQAVALSGGVFQNALMSQLMAEKLFDIPLLTQRQIPANDGGLAFGQALVAATKLET
ncbi:hydrogenase maturation carbamoyltransferase HypF [Rhodobacter aestuarii]|uniref:Carbamoyltransferase HypF n=1 Tax=Rhodobacter aestuarii TaxID=453582 RepID=A0A1N7KZD4_9RHOB|nr:carbamoyltransferase HypF [Rhodobacter aestuarii]PTV95485.1 hydrogenase maturation carbamoyltransferase HypF [Rhodobacter aestuarii]SIS66921.1 Hydrogenase maturation protein, carbamoyltransferase HypF [Rhodobacter aestuarii]